MVTSTGVGGELIDRDKMILAHLYIPQYICSRGIKKYIKLIPYDDMYQNLVQELIIQVDKRSKEHEYIQWLRYINVRLTGHITDILRTTSHTHTQQKSRALIAQPDDIYAYRHILSRVESYDDTDSVDFITYSMIVLNYKKIIDIISSQKNNTTKRKLRNIMANLYLSPEDRYTYLTGIAPIMRKSGEGVKMIIKRKRALLAEIEKKCAQEYEIWHK